MSKPSLTNELMRLAELRDKGVLTDEEFFVQKDKLLRGQEKQEPAPIYITQNQQQQQQQQQKQGGCLGSILKAIGALVVFFVLLAMCTNDDKRSPENTEGSVSSPIEGVSSGRHDEATLAEVKRQHALSTDEIGQVWEDLGPEVRAELKTEQIAWNRSKTANCKQYAQPYSDNQTEYEILNLQCEMEAMGGRIPELISARDSAWDRVLQKKITKANAENVKVKKEVGLVWVSLSSDVKAVIDSVDVWSNSVANSCSNGDGSKAAELERLNCENKEFASKLKELNGYKI